MHPAAAAARAGRAAARRFLLRSSHTAAPAFATTTSSGSTRSSTAGAWRWQQWPRRRAFHGGLAARLAEHVMKVPGMGDSITEGTIRSWNKQVGEAVKVDEVVCVIETDKVSVDIRANHAGVLAEQYAQVDDTVEVGANLLKIDTAGTPSVTASSPAPAQAAADEAAAPTPAVAAAPAADAGHEQKRKPLIKFLGKRALLSKSGGEGGGAVVPTAVAAAGQVSSSVRYEDIKGTPGAKRFDELPPMFGRPALSLQEAAAIESGGAD